MGKKGSWFSAIKRVFTPHSKEKLVNESEKKSSKKDKKKGQAKQRHGETNSFIPFFREPSSIEKILGDAEREHKIVYRPATPPLPEQPRTSSAYVAPRVASPRAPSPKVASPKAASPRAASPRVATPKPASPRIHQREIIRQRPEPTLRNHQASATKIQSAFRGYMARRSFRALRGLVRLQGVVRGQNVKRQTANALKYMQLLVRVQSQIQSRRIQMLENQLRHQAQYRNDKEVDSQFGKWSQASEAGNHDDWDDSLLTKEEIEARLHRKVEALIKRERAMAYAYSHQLWKSTPKSAHMASMSIPTGRFPWWWSWLDRQLPSSNPVESQPLNFQLTPPRPNTDLKPSPWTPPSSNKMQLFGLDSIETPKSSRSVVVMPSKQARTPPSSRIPAGGSSTASKFSRSRVNGAESPFDLPSKDDDSLTSCPPFSVPSYMAPTVSAKAKVRGGSNPRERFPVTPGSDSNRRISFPLAQGIGSFKWNKGSLFSGKDSGSQRVLDKHQPLHSIGNVSVDSTVSLPAGVGAGRKPFNRFV